MSIKPDIEIAKEAELRNIHEVSGRLGIPEELVENWGRDKAKIDVTTGHFNDPKGKVILVTAMSPTPFGEGKTTTSIGLSMALCALGKNAVVGIREPSMGPVFGMKGGAAGGGYSQVLPMEDINLHFTGDIHAITASHNLMSALINNSMTRGNTYCMDSRKIIWPRVVDMNDRSLRSIVVGLGAKDGGMIDQDRFDITAASEIMAIVCLAKDYKDLKERLGRMVIAFTNSNEPLFARNFNGTGAMAALLKDAFKPNLVQTIEGTPAIIHGGPFANIAHGTSSYIASLVGRHCADIYVTEAGFGSDLGAEKFFDIFCRQTETPVSAVVLVATIRALKYQGGVWKSKVKEEDLEALEKGFVNLERHIEIIRSFGYDPVVAINQTPWDTENELELTHDLCAKIGIKTVRSQVFAKGSEGGIDLAKAVLEQMDEKMPDYSYSLETSIKEKIEAVAKNIYGAGSVVLTKDADRSIKTWEKMGYGNLPVCIAKTQYSFSDDAKLKGAAKDFEFQIRDVRISAGAGFIVPISGEIMTMPGLPKVPSAENIDIDETGEITGLF